MDLLESFFSFTSTFNRSFVKQESISMFSYSPDFGSKVPSLNKMVPSVDELPWEHGDQQIAFLILIMLEICRALLCEANHTQSLWIVSQHLSWLPRVYQIFNEVLCLWKNIIWFRNTIDVEHVHCVVGSPFVCFF